MAFTKSVLYIAFHRMNVNKIPIMLYKHRILFFIIQAIDNYKKITARMLLIIAQFYSCHFCYAHFEPDKKNAVIHRSTLSPLNIIIKNEIFLVEVVYSLADLERGLMFKTFLAQNAGMLFLWPHNVQASFWMKNTYLALDLVFIDAGGKIVCIHKYAKPLSLKKLTCPVPIRAVLEINAGTSDRLTLKIGDSINHALFNNHDHKR